MSEKTATPAQYRWDVTVRRWDTYGDRVESKTPATVVASTKSEMVDKARVMVGATYDSFRKFWSHDVIVNRVDEEGA